MKEYHGFKNCGNWYKGNIHSHTTVSDGMILSMSEVEDINPEDLEVDFPLVVVGARTTWGKADHVTPNDVQAAASAAGYMFDCGVKSLAVVGGVAHMTRRSCSVRWKATRSCVCAASSKNAGDAA